MHLHSPLVLLALPVVILISLYASRRSEAGFTFSSGELLGGLRGSWKIVVSRHMVFVRIMALSLLVAALARPQSPIADARIQTEGVDIVLAIDCSSSMLAEDFTWGGRRENRIEVVKQVVRDFIRGRQNDRIAIVAFAARAYMICPLTLDYRWLLENLERVKVGLIEDSTAIGSAIASSLNRLKDSKAKSKVIILLTDGRNNAGTMAPPAAAEAAQALKVKIYTIGAGGKGPVPYPVKDFFGRTVYQMIEVDVDEDMLTGIATKTGGRYFRATDTRSLQEIYKAIDKMEKSPIEQKGYLEYNELFVYFLVPGLILLLLEILLSNTVLRKLP